MPEQWKQSFRMSREHFFELVDILSLRLEGVGCNYKSPTPVTLKVAAFLYRMSHGGPYHAIGHQLGLGEASVCRYVQQVSRSIRATMSGCVQYPKRDALQAVMDKFKERYGWECVGGAIDCSHIVIRAPFGEQKVDYRDRDGQWTIILQAVVDCDRRFLDVKVGWPGSSHDARVLHESKLLADMHSGAHPLRAMPQVQLRGCRISPYLLGDSGYPQCEWLMTPYSESQVTASPDPALTRSYNYQHSSMRICVECSFGLLKSVFLILSNKSSQLHNKAESCPENHSFLVHFAQLADRKEKHFAN